mgnify:CR=1 FL=1
MASATQILVGGSEREQTRRIPYYLKDDRVANFMSSHTDRRVDAEPFLVTAAAFLALTLGAMSASAPVQYSIFAVAIALCLTFKNKQLLYLAAILICTLGFFRRIMAGDLGRIGNDPLAMLPLAIVLIVVVRTLLEPRPIDRRTATENICYLMAGLTSVTYFVNPNVSMAAMYASGIAIVTWILIGLITAGRVPDVWPLIYQTFPYVGAVIGAYGIFQFFFLPKWDRAWMIASKLNSIGAPLPEQVRVFGTAESPGPYAIVLGLCLIVTLERSISERGLTRLHMIGIACLLIAPLALTAVRTGMLGIVLAGAFMSIRCLKGAKRFVPIIASALIYTVLVVAVRLFSRTSSVLTEGRLSEFDAANDNSLQSRLELLASVPQHLTNPLGQGVTVNSESGQSGSLDNAFIDILVRNGPVVALLLVMLTYLVLKSCWNIDSTQGYKVAAAASCIYLAFFMIAGNIFSSGSGLVAAIAFGTVLRYNRNQPKRKSLETAMT